MEIVVEDNKQDEMAILDLDEVLRIEREREKIEKKDLTETVVDDAEVDSDRLTPYKTDLEYLDDHFQVILNETILVHLLFNS